MWTNESKKSSCNGVCGSVYIYLGWLNCLCTSKWIHRLLAFNYPASTVLHIILQAGSHNACLKGKISLQEGRVIEFNTYNDWCVLILHLFGDQMQNIGVKRNVWIQQKRKACPLLCIQQALSSKHYQQGVKLQLKWGYTFSPNANVRICWCRHRKHDIFSLSKWMHAWRPHYGSMKMSLNKHNNWILLATKLFQPRNKRP